MAYEPLLRKSPSELAFKVQPGRYDRYFQNGWSSASLLQRPLVGLQFLRGKFQENFVFVTTCLAWYLSSSLTNNSGKQILIDFRYPVTLTYFQFAFVGVFCYLYARLTGRTRIQPLNGALLALILPVCVFTIFAHLLSSVAIAHVPVSVVHTIKALSPLFTVAAYRLLFQVRYSTQVYTSLVPLTCGVMLACSFELSSSLLGLFSALLSTLVCVAQNIFSKKYVFNDNVPAHIKKSLDKTNYLFYCSWMAFALMFPVWYYAEGHDIMFLGVFHSSDNATPTSHAPRLTRAAGFMVVNGLTHFAQCVLSVTVLSLTSAVSFSISSLLKRVFVIVMAILWFQQPVGAVQAAGIVLTFVGLYLYDRAKMDVNKKETKVNCYDDYILPTTAYKAKTK
ncbi:hypothetical protein IWQ60_001809 [Tieghemiomyces parasiticus]|uniref:Sugar phosphate transporter domain-containing protein n=1 Tax=Tieghemiomyces parasiticus TaxID=78921 RepID=A0A9W8DW89_9FUNG|nr:hypothetical protein IWQ60_001809 [Tieghemiomyces parasiticus]